MAFPLLLIPLAICNIIAFLMPDLSLSGPVPLFSIPLMSKDVWTVTLNDVLVALGILLLLLEVTRAARPAAKYFVDHFLSLLVFGAAAAEFVMLPKFGNSTFFLIALLAMVDFFAGISLRARRPRRVVAVAPIPEPVRAEPVPHYEPTPVPAPVPVPAATSVAEAVLLDHSEPKMEPKVGPAPEPKIKLKIWPNIEPRIETKAEPKIEPKIEPKVESKIEPKVESKIEPDVAPKIGSGIEPKVEPKPLPPEVVAHTPPQITSPDLQPGEPPRDIPPATR